MNVKKFIALTLSLVFVLSLCACGTRTSDGDVSADSSAQTWSFTIANTDTDSRSLNKAAKEFADYMSEQTDGRFQVRVAMNGELGDDEELLKAISLGTVDMYIGYNGIMTGLLGDKVGMFEMPFLFNDRDHFLRTMDNGGLDLYNKQLEGSGYYCVGMAYEGARQMLTIKPVTCLEDMKGLKIRCGNVQSYIDYYTAIGAAPTAIQFGEVYTSLAQGVIEAVDHVACILEDQGFVGAAKAYTQDSHIISPCCYMVSDKFLDTLPDDIREIFLQGVADMCAKQTEAEGGLEETLPTKWAEEGLTITILDDSERARFREAAQSVYDDYAAKYPELSTEAWALVEANA